MSLSDKNQGKVLAQIGSEVYKASLGPFRNTLERWCFYETLNFMFEHIGLGSKWDFKINVGVAKT